MRFENHISESEIASRVIEFIEETQSVNIKEAEIIVAGGRAVGGPEGFAMLKELADVLGGLVGASRAAVDAGWITHEEFQGRCSIP